MQQIPNNIFENITIKNLICHVNVCGPEWGETNCSYGFHKFYYFLEGEGTIIINGDEYHPQPGELFMIPANTIHTYYHNRLKPVYKYWCHFDLTFNEQRKLLYNRHGIKANLPKEKVVPIFEKLISLDTSYNLLDVLSEKIALMELLRLFFEQVNLSTVLADSSNNFVTLINEYITKNIRTDITLKQLSDLVHLHPNYFIQVFKKNFSVSPIEYVNAIRLQMAAQLLIHEITKSINEIAYEVGFNDYRYFGRLFKKRYGITPSVYRGTLNGNNIL